MKELRISMSGKHSVLFGILIITNVVLLNLMCRNWGLDKHHV